MKRLFAIALLAGMAAAQAMQPSPQPSPQPGPGAGVPRNESGVLGNAAATSETFTPAVANDLLFQLADGMESRNPRLTLAPFDAARLSDYGRFSGQVSAWLRDHSSFRVYYKLRQVSVEGSHGIALVDFQYEAQPTSESMPPVRRHEQMRFTIERGPKGWKIVDVSPRAFFS
jgi:hypothetical protein